MKNKTRTVSLRIIIALVLCLSIFFLSVLYIYQAYEGMKAGILSATQTTAQHLSEAVSQTIKATLLPPSVTLSLLRHDAITTAESFQERLASLNLLREALTSNPICSAVFVGYSTGEFFMLRKFSGSHPLVLTPAPKGTRYLLQTVTLQANGELLGELRFYGGIFNLLEHRILQDYRFNPRIRPWYQEAILSDRVEITPPYIFFSTGQIGVTLAAKDILGGSVVGMDVTAEDISGLLSSVLITPATEIVIVDHNNKALAYPQIDRLLIKEGDGYRLPQLDELGIPALNKLNVAGIPENTLTEFHDGARSWYGLVNPVSGFTTKEFKILIAIPSDELLAEAWRNLIRQVILAAAIMGAMIVGGWRLGGRLVEPLHKLTVQVDSLAEFDFETPIGVATRVQEVRALGGVLANMAKTISGFQNLSFAMNKEKNLERMLRAVLQQLLNIVQLETGAIYLYNEQDRVLKICVSQGGKAVATIPSSAQAADEDLIKEIQSKTGFNDILTVLRNREQVLVGVLSIRCDDSNACLMNNALIRFVNRIAGSAAVAIETRQLIQSQKALLDSIIKLVADAIDTKSRYTGAHCQRVPVLAIMIMDQIAQTQEPPFVGYTMTAVQREEFRIAA